MDDRVYIQIPVDLVLSFVDEEPCQLDHNGSCQAHGYFYLEPNEVCPQYELKLRLNKWASDTAAT